MAGTMKPDKTCPYAPKDDNDDGRPHPGLNLGVWFDGPQDTTLDELIAEVGELHQALVQFKAAGGTICSRDGRHVWTHFPGELKDDPFGLVEESDTGSQ